MGLDKLLLLCSRSLDFSSRGYGLLLYLFMWIVVSSVCIVFCFIEPWLVNLLCCSGAGTLCDFDSLIFLVSFTSYVEVHSSFFCSFLLLSIFECKMEVWKRKLGMSWCNIIYSGTVSGSPYSRDPNLVVYYDRLLERS